MSLLHAPRAPWIMLAVFSASALVVFGLTAGSDLGLIGATRPAAEIAAVSREVRMPIIIEKYETVKEELKEVLKEELEKPQPTAAPAPAPAELPPADQIQTPATASRPAPPQTGQSAGNVARGTVLTHSFHYTPKEFEARFRADRPVTDTKIFFKSSPAVWVLDLPGRWTNRSPRTTAMDQGPIAQVAIGEHDTFLRIVFRYRDKNQARPAEAPTVAKEETGLRVVIPVAK